MEKLKTWAVSITLSIRAVDQKEAIKEFDRQIALGNFSGDSIDVEEEIESV